MRSARTAPAFTAQEIARAAGVETADVLDELGGRGNRNVLVPRADAVRLVRLFVRRRQCGQGGRTDVGPAVQAALFAPAARMGRAAGLAAAAAGALHAAVLATVLLILAAGADVPTALVSAASERLEPLRLVYLAIPGPGGGGGGGGRRDRSPAPKAARLGYARVSSPLPARRPAPVAAPAVPQPEPPTPVLAAEPLPSVIAPVVPVFGDRRDRTGVLGESPADAGSRGPGTGSGTGSGTGAGVGEGEGPGVGPGSGGGTGGGPSRPGSGIEPPTVLREVKPTYTDAARQRGITGEVVLEVVVQRDGSVRSVRVLEGLGSGLDERAIDAVRQWRFSPARRLGQPVDVIVEVAVEFRLR
jgi:TonB family protein